MGVTQVGERIWLVNFLHYDLGTSTTRPPGWSTLIRPLANLPRSHLYECYEGIIETDRWFGPLFVNFRLTAINQPIHISMDFPIFQVQPLLRPSP